MNFIKTDIEGLVIIEPEIFGDDRGYFFESYSQEKFNQTIAKVDFIQDNESRSSIGVLRGLHFQRPPYTQAKLVRCIEGEVLDVAVDIRRGSPTYGKHITVNLSKDNKRQVFIPRGFAHGFIVLSSYATFVYKVDNRYSPDHDTGIAWNDSELNINWEMLDGEIRLSDKDRLLKPLSETDIPFKI